MYSTRRILMAFSGLATCLLISAAASDYYYPGEPLATNEMRIAFMGTSFLPRLSQAANSVFVECGNGESFVFDCGAGVVEKYVAMGVAYSQMDKIFLTHLHADHMSDLMFIYDFGPSTDRLTPLYVWGPSGSLPQEGVNYFCQNLRQITKWHRESFSFLSTGLSNGLDGYDLIVSECPYSTVGHLAYNSNGVRITSFPAVHDRDGAISYRLEWNGISMVFAGDSAPNNFMLNQATNLDVLIHEVTLSPETWAAKNSGLAPSHPRFPAAADMAKLIQDCSHTSCKAYGYILNQLELAGAAPRLAVATHCQFQPDTTNEVINGIRAWYNGPLMLATDLMVLNISADKNQPIRQRMAQVSSDAFYTAAAHYPAELYASPKYTNNMMQLSSWLQDQIIPAALYTNPPSHHSATSARSGLATQQQPIDLSQPAASNEMRIAFMGTSFLPRLSQAANSVFVECGNGESFVFDCGAGVVEKYVAAGVAYSRMDKIFLTHLHGDHLSDLMFIYCFGPSTDRLTPLYVWGPSGPNSAAPQGAQTNEGTIYACQMLQELTRWHRESFSFLSTGLTNGLDGYDLVPQECPYDKIGLEVYNNNGVRITSFPAIHDRDGAISFRLEWNGLAMLFAGDTLPNNFMLAQATNLDVLIHEVTLSPETWAAKNSGCRPGDPLYSNAVARARLIQDCSHTPALALGYILNQLELNGAAPRLAVATHCQFQPDTTNEVINDIRAWYQGELQLAKDLAVISVPVDKSAAIRVGSAAFSSNAFYTHAAWHQPQELATPKYTNNMMQLSSWLQESIIPAQLYATLRADVDFDGDGKMDPTLYNPETGLWCALLSSRGYALEALASTLLGGPSWVPVPGDYDGDRQTDPAVYNNVSGDWVALLSSQDYQAQALSWGGAEYRAVPGDYDGDRKADPAVCRTSSGDWHVLLSGNFYRPAYLSFSADLSGCAAVQRDYDGDGKVDPAVYQASSGYWYAFLSADQYKLAIANMGGPGYQPVPGDYDGDGKTDLAVYRDNPSIWYAIESAYGYTPAYSTFGAAGAIAVPGDYDGDLKTDPGCFQAAAATWASALSGDDYQPAGLSLRVPADRPIWLTPAQFTP